jgi:membrane protein
MSLADWRDRMAEGAAKRPPLWAIGLGVLLIALGVLRRRSDGATLSANQQQRREAGRGGSAETLSEIPSPGWKDILLRVYQGISEDRILLIAAGVTFYTLLSIFPGIAALFSIYGLFADPATIPAHLDTMENVAPSGAIQVLQDEMSRLAAQGGTTLGLSFLISLVISLWTAKSGITAIFDALNIVYEEEEKRGLVKYYSMALLFTVASVSFIILSIVVVVVLPVVLNYIPLPGVTNLVLEIARWPTLFVLVAFALAVLYRFGPSHTEPRWRWVSWGSALAAVVWLVASFVFSWYVANFGSYNKTYGSLGAIIGFLTWIWISVVVILVGAKLDAELEPRTARNATRKLKPLGARTADHVGAAQAD